MASVRKDLNRRMARQKGVKAAVRLVADEILAAAQSRAQAHRSTGSLARSLRVETGRTDARVIADDPLAVSKEYGHTDYDTGRPVRGAHVLGGAVADVASAG